MGRNARKAFVIFAVFRDLRGPNGLTVGRSPVSKRDMIINLLNSSQQPLLIARGEFLGRCRLWGRRRGEQMQERHAAGVGPAHLTGPQSPAAVP